MYYFLKTKIHYSNGFLAFVYWFSVFGIWLLALGCKRKLSGIKMKSPLLQQKSNQQIETKCRFIEYQIKI